MDCYLQDITGWRMKMNSAYPLKGSFLVFGRSGAHVEQSLLQCVINKRETIKSQLLIETRFVKTGDGGITSLKTELCKCV